MSAMEILSPTKYVFERRISSSPFNDCNKSSLATSEFEPFDFFVNENVQLITEGRSWLSANETHWMISLVARTVVPLNWALAKYIAIAFPSYSFTLSTVNSTLWVSFSPRLEISISFPLSCAIRRARSPFMLFSLMYSIGFEEGFLDGFGAGFDAGTETEMKVEFFN